MQEKTYTMSIEPSILELLGPSLYTNIYYVLAELIANAYDAQAKNVYIIANKDDITVEDDGDGMTYDEVTNHYLAVARESRSTKEESFTKNGQRRRMGRKGIGKLAALSVSARVLVQTRSGNDISGFVLSRHVNKDRQLEPLTEKQIRFAKITGNGTSIVMENPEYRLHRELATVKKNLAKIFPAVGKDFRVHIIRGGEEEILDGFDQQILTELCSIITLGEGFAPFADKVQPDVSYRSLLAIQDPALTTPVALFSQDGKSHEYILKIEGWLGAYQSTRGRKTAVTDFPDNHIALYANEKLGEFNILPMVGQNSLIEVFLVGELHVDLFEETELPDMALSNRQGYKSDDPRYQAMIGLVRDKLLPKIIDLRTKWADIQNEEKKQKKLEEQKEKEEALREKVLGFRRSVGDSVSAAAADRIRSGSVLTAFDVRNIVQEALNKHNPDLGLKASVDCLKKKLLISHSSKDADFATVAYKMLQYNGIDKRDIIFTSSTDQEARIPFKTDIFDYLRRFFVESASMQMIYVLFITSERMSASWAVLSEVGAAWITRSNQQIFNIAPFVPQKPLDLDIEFQVSYRDANDELYTDVRGADVYCGCIEAVCRELGGTPRQRDENLRYLGTLIQIRNGK